MGDNDNKNSDEFIDVVEKQLSKEDIAKSYVDIKQAAQIMNNVSARTAYRYLDKVSETHNVIPKSIDVPVNGGIKKLYFKEDIVSIAKLLNKDKMVYVYESVSVKDKKVTDKESNEHVSDNVTSSDKEMSEGGKDLQLANKELANRLVQTLDTVSENQNKFIQALDKISGNQEVMNKFCQQIEKLESKTDEYIDRLSNTYFEAKKEELELERQKIDLERNKRTPGWKIALIFTTVIGGFVLIGLGAWYFSTEAKQLVVEKEKAFRKSEEERTQKIVEGLSSIKQQMQKTEMNEMLKSNFKLKPLSLYSEQNEL